MNRRFYVLISLPFILVGAFMAVDAMMRLHWARASTGWPVTTGEITLNELTETTAMDGSGTFRLRVQFSYEVEGEPYEASTYTFGPQSTANGGRAKALQESYSRTPTVPVYYNPKRPSQAVLQPGEDDGIAPRGGAGVAFIVIGCFAIGRGMLRGYRN